LGVQVGKDGSKVVTETGSTFTYNNKFGGYWVVDPANPFNSGAKAQSYTPALNETFKYGIDRVYGVNLGGWLNLEPFITPALYQKYQNAATPAIDEWTLHENMAADKDGGGLQKMMEQHYSTFITEEDFAQIAAAGLNHVRIPIPYWAIEALPDEPFLPKLAWKYFLKAIEWSRKYGIRINLDLHAVSGSQNGYNHSGKHGKINFMYGVMGLANVQRTLDHIRIIAQFISQPQYADVITIFSILNEPLLKTFGEDNMYRFNYEAYSIIRNITGIGEGKGAYIAIHDGFNGISNWAGFMPGADRLVLDTHTYFCFGGVDRSPLSQQRVKPCRAWGANQNNSMANFGMTVAGEFSLGHNDCGLFLNGVGSGTRWEGTFAGGAGGEGDCTEWNDWTKWDQNRKNDLKNFALSSMDALQNWFFWTWKIGNSTKGVVEAPLWSYQLGLQNGWMPTDPRAAIGQCAQLGVNSPWTPPLKPSQTGGAGAGQVAATFIAQYGDWPPASIASGGDASLLPSYTPTGSVSTLPPPTITAVTVAVVDTASPAATSTVTASVTSVDAGNGWYKKDDTALAYVPVSGCTYPDRWDAITAQVPPKCTGPPTGGGGGMGGGGGAPPPPTVTTDTAPAAEPSVDAPPAKRMHVVAARVTPIA
jgi:aryl-phospho-beta-D-glucosidase BglC (GH1 family)